MVLFIPLGQNKPAKITQTKKTKVSPEGDIADVQIADWVDIGFYADTDEEELLFRERNYMNKENIKLTFTLDSLPKKAAIDPLRILIERIYDDNRKRINSKD